MSQHRNNNNGQAVMTTILNTMASKKSDYKEGLTKNHQLCMGIADRLAIGGGLEHELMAAIQQQNDDGVEDPIMPKEEIQQFLTEQRNRLKRLAERNVEREGKIDDFVGALTDLKQKVLANGELCKDGTQYEATIQELMKEQEISRKAARTDPKDSEMYRNLCKTMGEKVDTGKPGGGDDDDDDIEVVRNYNDNGAELKCPITAMLYEEPVKSNKCNHVYSKEGILQHLKNKRGKTACPVAGCTNDNLTKEELLDDHFTAQIVKRLKRKQAAEEEHKMKSQALDMDDDEDEE